jgi:hypothetical protein
MKKVFMKCCVFCIYFSLSVLGVNAQNKQAPTGKTGQTGHVMLKPSELKWMDGPEGLPAGSKIAVLEGDPAKAGPFTIRLIFPPNYKIMPHWHSNIEHGTVLEGEFYMGHGDTFDEAKASLLPVGSFAVMPVKFHHYAFTKDKQTVIQLHGMGPFDINYIDAANDPRTKKK